MEIKEKNGLPLSAPETAKTTAALPLSVYMIIFNNGDTVERALQSIHGWAGEIIVVDSHGTDNGCKIAEKYTAHVFQFDTTDLRKKYQFAQDKCSNRWVLFIDADEWLTDEFKDEVRRVISSDAPFDGYVAHRRNYYLGREIKYGGWYPDREVRLYRKDKGGWKGGIHARVYVEGKTGALRSYYLHRPYEDTAHQIRTIDRYASAYAGDLFRENRRFHVSQLVLRPLFRFFRDYILKVGFLDGIPGLIIAISTVYYVFMKQAKLWELEKKNGHDGTVQG